MNVNMDFLGNGQAQGQFAQQILANSRLDVGAKRPFIGSDGKSYVVVYTGGPGSNMSNPKNWQKISISTYATLRRDEWKQLDEALLMASRTRLNGVQDLIDKGLVYNLGNGMGSTVLEYHDVKDAMVAEMTMDGVSRSIGDRSDFGVKYLPIPVLHVDYEINQRVLEASRKMGNALDTTAAEMATRAVLLKREQLLFTDTTYAFGGGTIYSYLNHPDRNTGSLGTAWSSLKYDSSGSSGGETVVDKVIAMKQASITALHQGPWMLYIPTTYETVMDKDYDKTTPGTTIRERILKVDGIQGVKVIDTLTDGNVLLVQMSTDVVRLVRGLGLQNIQWNTEGGWVNKFKVVTIEVPQIRSDANGKSGIVHYSV
jgi:hypothetical protein